MFGAWGRLVHRRRRLMLALSGVLLILSVGLFLRGGELASYTTPEGTQSAQAAELLDAQLGTREARFIALYAHPDLTWRDAAFKAALLASLEPLRADPRIGDVLTPYDMPPTAASGLVSRDGHRAIAIVTMTGDPVAARDEFPSVRALLDSPSLDVQTTASVAIYAEIQAVLDEDLVRSEVVSLPLTLLLLLVVFGGVVAALLPLGVGVLSVLGGVGGVFFASGFTDMSVYALNIVTLIGLGVAIDYSLFMVSRYREERAHRDPEDAMAVTMATAGRATAYSGLTVAVGLAGLSFYKGLYFASIGVAGAIVVALAVVYALTFLPAILAMLGPRIDALRLPLPRPRQHRDAWGRLARAVMRRPMVVLVPTLLLILAAGSPFLRLEMGSGGVEMLPRDAESRIALETLQREFVDASRNTISVVIEFPGDPLERERVGALHDLTRVISARPGVTGVDSIVDVDARLDKQDYQDLYAQPRADLPAGIQRVVNDSVGTTIALVSVRTDAGESTPEARAIVDDLRSLAAPADGRLLVTGASAVDADTLALVARHTPAAIAFVVATTYILLLAQTGSIVLPAKAILMNVLSIAASFGALVWIFQEGNLSAILNFTPAPLDPSLPVLLFCIVFGLSMDYEVLLLSRMHEEYVRTGDNTAAVAHGLAKSGRLITSAAAIMVVVFGAFALAQVTIIKALGFGLALAILLDATIVRALVVPAAMRLMGRANWWAPTWLTPWLRRLQH